MTASGRVTIDGQAAAEGRLLLNPVDAGKLATARVGSDGAFELLTGGKPGAQPGQYHVLVKLNSAPADGATGSDQPALIYESPRDSPMEIPAAGSDELLIGVGPETGWQRQWSQ